MNHTFQCLVSCTRCDKPDAVIVIAASGSYIHTFSAQDGNHLSSWPSNQATEGHVGKSLKGKDIGCEPIFEPPQKRRKLSAAREDSSSSAEIVMDGGSEDVEGLATKAPTGPPISKLICTSNGQHVIVVTGEDKCLRVFQLTAEGALKQLSERFMPKRPSAIALTTDDATIICADKFGDVYSLPLLGQTNEASTKKDEANGNSTLDTNRSSQPSFVPSATSLTVHTERNREALRQQQKVTNQRAEKASLNFDHQLLLGHVSLLTDVTYVSIASSSLKPRDYMLTSDRDEHIRVSRGIPQAHVIEGYCLGHTEFVSKLCIPRTFPHLLISGGGDDYLLAWDWLSGSIRQKIEIRSYVDSFIRQYHTNATSEKHLVDTHESAAKGESNETQIAIRNILAVETRIQTQIAVTCEGVPALFMFFVDLDAKITFNVTIPLDANVIDLVFLPHTGSVLYSMDAVHQPFSTTIVASGEEQKSRPSVGAMQATESGWEKGNDATSGLVASMQACLVNQHVILEDEKMKGRSLRELLYTLEVLRKRGSEDDNQH